MSKDRLYIVTEERWRSYSPTYCSNDFTEVSYAGMTVAKNQREAISHFPKGTRRLKRYFAKRVEIPNFKIKVEPLEQRAKLP